MSNCKNCGVELDWSNSALCIKCKAPICETCFETNQMKCKECNPKEEPLQLEAIRRSHIEDYKMCPYYFKLNVIDGLDGGTHPLAQLGIDCHDLYDMVQRGKIDISEIDDRIDKIIDEYKFEGWLWEKYTADEFKTKAHICNKNFKYLMKNVFGEPIAFEERIFFDVGKDLPQVTIAYDRLEKDEFGNLHVIDFKTGKCMSGKKLTTDLQPALYIYAVYKQYGVYPETFRLYYLSDTYKDGSFKERIFHKASNTTYVCNVGKKSYTQDITAQLKEVKRVFGHIKNKHFSMPERENFKCRVCKFKEDGHCQGALVQDFYNGVGDEWSWK